MKHNCDFSGYATKNDIVCADGRTIKQNAFADQDGCGFLWYGIMTISIWKM